MYNEAGSGVSGEPYVHWDGEKKKNGELKSNGAACDIASDGFIQWKPRR